MADPVVIHTDQGASGNPGPGGYGAILQWADAAGRLRAPTTTNNRMELLAVIVALGFCDGTECWVVSDSKYVIDSAERLGLQLGEKGFKGKKNPDLWQRFLKVYRRHNVRFDWVKGHRQSDERTGRPFGRDGLQQKGLLVDDGYEASV